MGPMTKLVGAAAVALALWAGTAIAEDLTAASSCAIVERQFEAFQRDDGQAAYALAAPTIKDMFSDADHFMAMIRDHYAPVYRHRSADFGAFKKWATKRASRRHSSTTISSFGRRSTAFGANPTGDWLISGCVLATGSGAQSDHGFPFVLKAQDRKD